MHTVLTRVDAHGVRLLLSWSLGSGIWSLELISRREAEGSQGDAGCQIPETVLGSKVRGGSLASLRIALVGQTLS